MKKLSLIIFFLWSLSSFGQSFLVPSDTLNPRREKLMLYGTMGTTVLTLAGLQFAWYMPYQTSKFRLFNDWVGWQQMDKAGHAATAYQVGWGLYKAYRWAGISKNKSLIWSTTSSFGFQLVVETMDGFSEGWGFSLSDVSFNTLGTTMFAGQQLVWDEQRIQFKYSFTPVNYNQYTDVEQRRLRNLFGSSVFEQWLKDYNAQTYWVSANIWSLIGKPDRFPKWINVAAGYSSNNLFGAQRNWWYNPDDANEILSSSRIRERQFLLSLDIDLTKVNLPKPLLWMRPVFGVIKIPFPALEWNNVQGLKGHWLYF